MTQTSLRAALQALNVDQLKGIARRLREPMQKARKAELVAFLRSRLIRKTLIRQVVNELDSLERSVLAEAVHRGAGELDLERFRARYGTVPDSLGPLALRPGLGAPSGMQLLVFGNHEGYFVPREFHAPLRALLDPPEPVTLQPVDQLPKTIRRRKLVVHDAAQVARRELGPVLRLVHQRRLKVTPRKRQPTKASLEMLSKHLIGGDHYPDRKSTPRYEQAGPIRAFAWPQLLQAGKVATLDGDRLVLTATGRKAMSRSPDDTLRALWRAWMKWDRFDEFSRIDSIQGQHHGPGGLTAVTPRRQLLARALAKCPVEKWTGVDDFVRFMHVEGFAFEVCKDPWELYVEDRRYGALGYDGFHGWNVLQKRYVLAVLFEYAATLGLVDLASIHPTGAEADYELWGADCLPFLSRYDGLQYFRLNDFGAWCLGTGKRPTGDGRPAGLHVMPSLLVKAPEEAVDARTEMMLDTWATREGKACWRLDGARMLAAIENGLELEEFRRFLAGQDQQPLPEPVDALFKECATGAGAVWPVEPAMIHECRDRSVCRTIAEHPEMIGLCQRVGDMNLVVATRHESRFREALRVIGFGLELPPGPARDR